MTTTMKYTLNDFQNITFDGFEYELPESVLNIISTLAAQVGSPTYVKTPVFKKKEHTNVFTSADADINGETKVVTGKKKKNKNVEINDDDWEAIRSFQATKIEQKDGIEGEINNIRSYLNKLSDKTYDEYKIKIIGVIDKLMDMNITEEEIDHISNALFDIASNNRFYSKLYADVYSEIISKFIVMKTAFDKCLLTYLDLFREVDYVDPNVDYDKFCKINKNNEKRKALSLFFINLMNNKLVEKSVIAEITCVLLEELIVSIEKPDNKNKVDEITENVAILCVNDILEDDDYVVESDNVEFDGLNIKEVVDKLAHSKVKDYLSLSNKTIFKFMDMIDM